MHVIEKPGGKEEGMTPWQVVILLLGIRMRGPWLWGEPEENLFPLGHVSVQVCGSLEVMLIRQWDQCVWSPGKISGPEVQIGRLRADYQCGQKGHSEGEDPIATNPEGVQICSLL